MIQTMQSDDLEQLLIPGIFISKKILVAEDDELNFFLIKEYLEFSKAEIIWVQNGLEAVLAAKSNSDISIILMDIQMPEMNGYEALKEIKAINSDIPIIALTAYAVKGDREKGLKAGFNEYISKPVSRKVLITNIQKFTM
jgi:CheY-like chemotaxis protein